MLEGLQLFSDSKFIPHEQCYLWAPIAIGLHIASNLVIGVAYFSMLFLLVYFLQQRFEIPYRRLLGLLSIAMGVFTIAHLIPAWTLEPSLYWLSGLLKAIATGMSLYVAIELAYWFSRDGGFLFPLQTSSEQRTVGHSSLLAVEAQASSQRLSLLIQQSPLGVIEWTPDLAVVDWNPAAEKIFGYTKQEVLGRHAIALIVPEMALQQVGQVAAQLLQQQGGTRSTNANITKDGTQIYCEWYNTPLVNAEGQVVGIASLVQDITEQKLASLALQQANNQLEMRVDARTQELKQAIAQLRNEVSERQQVTAALREREQQYRSVVDNVKEVIFQSDRNGLWTFLNPAWTEITGFAIAYSIGTSCLDYVHPDDRQRYLDELQPLMAGQKEYCRYEVRYLTVYGRYRWIEVLAQLAFDANGNTTGTCGTLKDITERHVGEEALCKRQRYLAALVEVQQQLLAFKGDSNNESLDPNPYTEILRILGQVSGASRVYVVETDNPESLSAIASGQVTSDNDDSTRTAQPHGNMGIERQVQCPSQNNEQKTLRERQPHNPTRHSTSKFPQASANVTATALEKVMRPAPTETGRRGDGEIPALWQQPALSYPLRQSSSQPQPIADDSTHLFMSQRAQWCAPGIPQDTNHSMLQNRPGDNFFPRWLQVLSQDEIITGVAADFPESERLVLEFQGILSILMLPLKVNGKFFGFIGFDNCVQARPWQASEVDLLRAAAASISLWYEGLLAQKALRQSEATNRALLEAIPDALLRLSKDGTYLDFIPAKNLQTPIAANKVVGKKVFEVLPPEWARKVLGDVKAALHTGKVQVSEGLFQFNGKQRYFEIRTVFYKNDEALMMVRDLTDRQQAEAARRKSEARLRKQHKALSDLARCQAIYSGNLSAALQEITQTVTRTLDAQRCSIWLYNDDDRNSLHCLDLYELRLHRHSASYQLSAIDYPEYFKALFTERIIAAADAHADPRLHEFSASYLTPLGITSVLIVPIHLGGLTVGVLWTEHIGAPRHWSLEEQNFVSNSAYMASLAMEASHRAATEKALRSSEEQFRQLTENIREVFFLTAPDFSQILYISPVYEEVWGRTPQSLYERPVSWLESVHPKDRDRVSTALSQHLQDKLAFQEEYRIVRPDGSVRWVWVRAFQVLNEAGSVVRIAGIAEDITEHRQADEALRASEAKYRALVEKIPAVTYIAALDDTSTTLYISPQVEALLGYSQIQYQHHPHLWYEQLHPDDRESAIAIRHRFLTQLAENPANNEPFVREYRLRTRTGQVLWIRDEAVMVTDEAGQPLFLQGVMFDITKRKRAESEILNALAKEKELGDLKSRFVSIASHEFRTPLTTILSTAELLEHYNWTKEEQFEQLHLIQDAVKDMLQLLEDILFIGTADAGQLRFNPEPLLLNEFCQELVAQIERGISLTSGPLSVRHAIAFSCRGQTFLACLDKRLLRQLLANLLSNAIKYSPAGGSIDFELVCQGEQAIFKIQDRGIGIPKEDQSRLFEFFHRGRNVGAIAGTGLGLAIVKTCVDLHRGEIAVNSEVGVGTEFIVTLPLKNPFSIALYAEQSTTELGITNYES
ncbi:MAG TPA: PAS domain S-box protein [Allocoleopsis sp.]